MAYLHVFGQIDSIIITNMTIVIVSDLPDEFATPTNVVTSSIVVCFNHIN